MKNRQKSPCSVLHRLALATTLGIALQGYLPNIQGDKIFNKTTTVVENAKDLSWDEVSAKYQRPAWFGEAKFGIWVHWGGQTQPEQGGGWYARHLYQQDVGREKWGENAYRYHNETYGHPSEKGYKDVLNEWKADKLDTDALLTYFKGVGAKYFVALANHHDHFDNWDSSHHPWNSVNVGPKRDIIGEFSKSSKKVQLPFGVSSHDDRFLHWLKPAFGADKSGPKKGIPYDGYMTKEDGKGKWWQGLDPADLYGLPPAERTDEYLEKIKTNWLHRHTELVTKYDIDMLWFDGHGFPYSGYGKQVGAALYNNDLKKNGKFTSVIIGKYNNERATISDIERGVAHEIQANPWQSITTPKTWFYKEEGSYRHNVRTLVEVLSDVISKNGNLLLNVELLPDGTIPPEQKAMFDEFGQWLKLNAAAIYTSEPWEVYGDNLSSRKKANTINADETDLAAQQKKHKSNNFNERTVKSPAYGIDEVRFTQKGDRLFMFVLNPAKATINIPALGLANSDKTKLINSVRLIGSNEKISFNQTNHSLELTVPQKRPNQYTAVFEISGAL
ncbi:alpha-L-fucosidase [Thalassotalea sp. ND16A]|uniref:alpha-L-fucosidase n=1 Tax=Thalassotalea sp. ND16A TaxID=1535422 RepID=UPI00051D5515|nr:alpha-L-fucosidase [Thalassotalea sp. ND16A]KGK00118.1 Alpha-L-fucosidase [Thalassotalea sp. ND16A]